MDLALAQQIISDLLIEGKVIQIHENNKGLINQTFIIWVENENIKKYILQSVNTNVFTQYHLALENIIEVKKSISKSSFPYQFPTPINNKYISYSDNVWRLIPFVKNSVCFTKISNKKFSYEAAKCLGEFYYHLQDFNAEKLHETIPDFHNANKRYNQFKEAVSTAKQDRKFTVSKIVKKIQIDKNILNKFDKLNKNLPVRVCHFDTKISNFLFDNKTNKAKAIIDFDTLMPGTVLSDIGDMIRTHSNLLGEESSDFKNIKADREIINLIINAFMKHSGNILTEKEKSHLLFSAKALTLLQCIRFLTDYLNNDIYYKTTYENQNWVRAQNQWHLYCSIKNF